MYIRARNISVYCHVTIYSRIIFSYYRQPIDGTTTTFDNILLINLNFIGCNYERAGIFALKCVILSGRRVCKFTRTDNGLDGQIG